jgi:hypothetical protein
MFFIPKRSFFQRCIASINWNDNTTAAHSAAPWSFSIAAATLSTPINLMDEQRRHHHHPDHHNHQSASDGSSQLNADDRQSISQLNANSSESISDGNYPANVDNSETTSDGNYPVNADTSESISDGNYPVNAETISDGNIQQQRTSDDDQSISDGQQQNKLYAPLLRSNNIMLPGGEIMGVLVRSFDWSNTELGPISQWPHSLVSATNLILNSRFPVKLQLTTNKERNKETTKKKKKRMKEI